MPVPRVLVDRAWLPHCTRRQAEMLDAIIEHGSARAAARVLGISAQGISVAMKSVRARAAAAGIDVPVQQPMGGALHAARSAAAPIDAARSAASPAPAVRRWLLTAAQDDTPVDAGFWRNLVAYAASLPAQIIVAGFTYQKGLFEDHATRTAAFAPDVAPYLAHARVACGPLIFFADVNILPTAVRPLSGMETMSRGQWAAFPHAKTQLVSVPTIAGRHPAMVMTTGACTGPNYIQKKAGQKAEFHHSLGATIVEVDAADRVFARQIGAASDGSFQDLDVRVASGVVSRGHRIEAATWGDIHREQLDPLVALTTWGFDVGLERVVTDASIVAALRPRYQFYHDLVDGRARNSHRRNDAHHAARMIALGADRVEAEIALSARFLRETVREDCQSVVVASNHHDQLLRWLRDTDARADPLNARYWCEMNAAIFGAIERGDSGFDVFAHALRRHDPAGLGDVEFVPRNGSFVICQAAGGIECGLHGDEGPNGARGSPANMIRVAVRINRGHDHTASILDGVCTGGLSGLMDQGYNSGPSSWSHTHIITYPNGKRTLLTLRDGRWRA